MAEEILDYIMQTCLFFQALVKTTLPNSVGKEILLLANCLHEAENPTLYELANELMVLIANVPLLPSDILSLGRLIAKSSIMTVSLFECNLSPDYMKSFVQGLGNHSLTIKTFFLTSFSIEEQSVAIISEWIRSTGSKIGTLCLSHCNIGWNGLTCIIKSMKGQMIQKLLLCMSNIEIDENNGSMLQDFIISTPFMKTLYLSYNEKVGNIGAHYIAQALRHNTTLKTLDLSRCGITLPGVITLCDSLETNTGVYDLNLSQNDIGDDGIIYLSHSLQLNKTLTALNVMCCIFTKLGLESLAQMLTFNTTITKISWADVTMTTTALKVGLASSGLLTPSVEAVLF